MAHLAAVRSFATGSDAVGRLWMRAQDRSPRPARPARNALVSMMTLCSAFCLLSRNAYSSSHSVGITYDYRVRLRRTSPLGVLIPEIPTVLPVELIDFRPRGCRRLDQLLLDLFLDALEPAFGADSAVLRAFDLGLEPVDPVFGGPQLLARLLQHLDDGAAGLLRGTAGAARFLRCESAHRFGYTARALTDRCRAVHGACAPR